MFTIVQSNDTQKLADRLTVAYRQYSRSIFDEFVVIVPAKVLEEWLKKTIAKRLGISSLFTTQFWGQYQWQLIGRVLECDARYLTEQNDPNLPRPLKVPETALLSASVIRWRLFSYLADDKLLGAVLDDENHALHALLSPLLDKNGMVPMAQLWRFCDGLARLYVGYLTERTDWLDKWTAGRVVNVDALIAGKEQINHLYGDETYLQQQGLLPLEELDEEQNATPDWLILYYQNLERALRFLWKAQFASVYRYRTRLEHRFWQVLEDKTHPAFLQKNELLPKPLYLFTVQQLPQIELDFLKRLSLHTDIILFHFNPSMAYWADIKDKHWLQTQRVINPDKVQFLDYGHGLLSRLGKSARETLAMLSDMAGGGDDGAWQVIWHDIFDETLANTAPTTLLEYLKVDILALQESPFDGFELSPDDDSLVIHNCHSLKRQLEIARLLIGKWLNGTDKNGNARHLSDIAIMLPDVQSHHELIRSVFVRGVGMDGLTLPAQITGVVDESTHKLWAAILGVYQLPAGRLYADAFFDWLVNPYVYQAFGLTFEQALRAIDLLLQAGFVRGLDEYHLKQTLHDMDTDFRRTLAFAIDRLSLSLSMEMGVTTEMLYPFVWQQGQMIEKTTTLAGVTLDDGDIVQALCGAYLAIVSVRDDYEQKKGIEEWLQDIEKQVINRYFYLFRDTQNLKSIFDAMNAMKASIRANSSYHYTKQKKQDKNTKETIQLPLKFVLDALSDGILSQQIAAEPSGMITFGRFGSLRGISFGLVIMLGMNLSEFPRTEPINRLDLKKAGLPRRGDRISEDDDNGAFLEAILQARDNCWIFYDGQSNDGKKQLPASPVGELLAFLKGLDWDFETIEPQLLKKHTPTPFHRDNFETDTGIVSPILWQNVYHAMLGNRHTKLALIDLPNEQQIGEFIAQLTHQPILSGNVNLSMIANALKNPAKTYLKDKLYFADEKEQIINEPLTVNALENYQLNQLMIQSNQTTMDNLLYDTTLPAGVSRQTLVNEKQKVIYHITEHYHTKLAEYQIVIKPMELSYEFIPLKSSTGDLILHTKLPQNADVWHTLKVQSFGMDKLIECYLLHLCWQIQLNHANTDFDKLTHRSVWFFCKEPKNSTMVIFEPMTKQDASLELMCWIKFYELIKEVPICLTPKNAMAYLANQQTTKPELPEQLFEEWLTKPHKLELIYEHHSHHRYWQTILGNHDPLSALMAVLPIADKVYRGLFFNSQIIHES